MKGRILIHMFLYISLIKVQCDSKETKNSKKLIPYFRRQVEEMEENNASETSEKDDPRSNLVSFLVNNVKEIFDDLIETTERRSQGTTLKPTMTKITNVAPSPSNSITTFKTVKQYNNSVATKATISSTAVSIAMTTPKNTSPITTIKSNQTIPNLTTSISSILTTSMSSIHTTAISSILTTSMSSILTTQMPTTTTSSTGVTNENLTLTLLDDKRSRQSDLKKKSINKNDKMDQDRKDQPPSPSPHIGANASDHFVDHDDPRRSCIHCNNVAIEDCNDPKNKLIQSVMCERDDDLCYSMHTPFGIIDRGCYNSNHNLTTYVCSCNLCNYISISEMPYTFNSRAEWIDNVIEISRTRHFRKSIFKDMSCLRCEVNSTVQKADLVESANCLEGSIGNIPVEECEQNEVCAVKAHRADGYIWRGCVRTPLYNYWWQFCDYDLCNYDNILSLYDFI